MGRCAGLAHRARDQFDSMCRAVPAAAAAKDAWPTAVGVVMSSTNTDVTAFVTECAAAGECCLHAVRCGGYVPSGDGACQECAARASRKGTWAAASRRLQAKHTAAQISTTSTPQPKAGARCCPAQHGPHAPARHSYSSGVLNRFKSLKTVLRAVL